VESKCIIQKVGLIMNFVKIQITHRKYYYFTMVSEYASCKYKSSAASGNVYSKVLVQRLVRKSLDRK
jgi:hypothetical protein